MWRRVGKIGISTVMLLGSKDTVVPPGMEVKFRKFLGGERVGVKITYGETHDMSTMIKPKEAVEWIRGL